MRRTTLLSKGTGIASGMVSEMDFWHDSISCLLLDSEIQALLLTSSDPSLVDLLTFTAHRTSTWW